MDTLKNFLRVIAEPKDPATVGIDIVAVHGLNPFKNTSNAVSTWTSDNGKMWLQDEEFLPSQIPNARIMLFGYNSNVAFTSSNAGLAQQAANLLFLLDSHRENCPERPIIFICHSLGGILVKRALVHSRLGDRYARIYDATYGMIFFGTPHGGGNNAKVGSLAANIAKFLANRDDNSFMEALKKNSFYGEQNRDDFLLLPKKIAFLTFYEANPTKKFKVITTQVVDRQNAVLGLDDEREPKFAMDADHSQICKFSDPQGDDYLPVWTSISEMCKQAVEKSKVADHPKIGKTSRGFMVSDANVSEKEETYFILPPRAVSRFVKREALMTQLQEYSTRIDGTASPVVVLLGMGGQGKSQLALEFCRAKRQAREVKAIFWIDATSNSSLARSFEDITAKVFGSARVYNSIASRIADFKETIESWNWPWLLVFDNYDRPDEVLRISDSFPQTKFGSIIVTSRHASSTRLGSVIHVDGMSEDESLNLLFCRSELQRTGDNIGEAKTIVAQLGQLPLAIDQAGSYISAQKLPISLFATHYKERKAHILTYTPSLSEYRKNLNESDAETALNVFTTLELSLQAISGSNEAREATEDFLTLSAFFSNKSIGEDLARIAAENQQPDLRYLFWSEDVWDHYKYQDTISFLNNLSLLQSVNPGDVTYFSLHPLVADWLKLRRDIPSCQAYTLRSCATVGKLIDSEDTMAMRLGPRQHLLAHVDSCIDNLRTYMNRVGYENEALLNVVHILAGFLFENARYEEAEAMYQQALSGYEKVLGADHKSTLYTVNNLGALYCGQGRLEEAEAMYERALHGHEKALGADHPSALDTVNNLGALYRHQDRLEEAEAMLQQALQGYEKALGADHPSALDTVNDLGILYDKQGRIEEAEAMYQRALQGKEKVLGADHKSTLDTVNNLGALYCDQGRLEEAEAMFQQTLQGYEKALGAEHTSTLDTVNNLGVVYHRQGRLKEAKAMYQRTLQGYEKALGTNHPKTIVASKNITSLSLTELQSQNSLKEIQPRRRKRDFLPRLSFVRFRGSNGDE